VVIGSFGQLQLLCHYNITIIIIIVIIKFTFNLFATSVPVSFIPLSAIVLPVVTVVAHLLPPLYYAATSTVSRRCLPVDPVVVAVVVPLILI